MARADGSGYGLRDDIAAAICNWTLCHIAGERYRQMINGAIRYGMAAAARDEREGISSPCDLAPALAPDEGSQLPA